MMEVIPVGSAVLLANGDVEAYVTAIVIRDRGYVQYECEWWTDGVCKSAWFTEKRVQQKTGKRSKVGFTNSEEET